MKSNKLKKVKRFKTLKKLNCSPKPKDKINNFSCYTTSHLIKLKEKWNLKYPDLIIKSNNPKTIHNKLSNYLKNVCSNEACWLKQTNLFYNTDFKDDFAPKMPSSWVKNPNEWLSSIDIMNVMRQYEKAYKCFEFIGPSPIDFDKITLNGNCVWDELCNFDINKQIEKNKTKIGIIFNTDPHNKPGQHWISLFINIKKKKIFFFDSTGDRAPNEIFKLVERIIEQGKKCNPPIKFTFDTNEGIEHQYGNTECGIYSIYFIIHFLEDKLTEHYLKTHIIKDEYMQKFRKIYFNNEI